MKVKKYRIVAVDSPLTLMDVISDFIKGGWQPFGTPFLFQNFICQVMVIYEIQGGA